ncbi:alpha/beta fold hydrolase [Geodermatophilus marinus]|uniref:alpha/beta fold hydrolase n=1 Tax=Geodermatophilus sp. LHW52908 TaxID=2303986 RepID=UPI000E3D0E22|nr:alpha/beta hydrolase [Geodermatophilus sp. LHW52908]RFU21043.1 alpha/beta hydrolase [Geodermatophilus sp. LHW52908]
MDAHEPPLVSVTSRDGTPIAWESRGRGPALVLVHGTTADRTRWRTVRPLLEPHVTMHAVDRRGRGASGDAGSYALEREAEDVAAVVEAVAGATGTPVDVLGHSYGAHCALEAALLTDRIRRLALYEPAVQAVSPPGWRERMEGLLAEGRREEVVLSMLSEVAGVPPEHLALMRADPSWAGRVAAAHTVVRETRAEEEYRFDGARFAGLGIPVLLMAGTESSPELAAASRLVAGALPGARVVELPGQGHVAMTTAPELFAGVLLDFLRARQQEPAGVRDAAGAPT